MNHRWLTIAVAVLVMVICGGVIIHAVRSRPRGLPEPEPPPVAPAARQAPRDQAPRDPLGDNLFPPELIMQFQAQIGLSDTQRQAIMAEMQQAQPRFEELHQQLQQERTALQTMLGQGRVDLDPALAQADKVQALEAQVRRAQLTLLITLKNHLTLEQQARLQEIKPAPNPGRGPGPNPPPVILEKMQQFQAGVQRWQREGKDASSVAQVMQRFEPLLRGGQFKEAEAVLDEALALLQTTKER